MRTHGDAIGFLVIEGSDDPLAGCHRFGAWHFFVLKIPVKALSKMIIREILWQYMNQRVKRV